MESCYIYALLDPRDQSVRYVGKTKTAIELRLKQHISHCRRGGNHRAHWIAQLVNLDLKPTVILLESVASNRWQEAERFWIAHFKAAGANLTNSTSGGEAQTEFTPEARSNMSKAHLGKPSVNKGRKHGPEVRANMSAAHKGKPSPKKGIRVGKTWNKGIPASPEARAKLSAAKKGKPGPMVGKKHTDAARAKMSATRTGRKYSAEARANMNASKMGRIVSAETRAKISAANTGKTHTPETRAKLREKLTGKKHDAQARANMSAGTKAAWARRKAAATPPQLPLDL